MRLKIFLNNPIVKRIINTSLFYILSFFILAIAEHKSPSGPCVPGLGMVGFFLLIPVSVVLFLISLYKGAEVNKVYLYSSLTHLLVWLVFFLWLMVN